MASLIEEQRNTLIENTRFLSVLLTDAEEFFDGGYYGVDLLTGRLTELTDVATKTPMGILDMAASDSADLSGAIPLSVTGDTSASPEPKVTMDIGPKFLKDVPVATKSLITDVGDEVFLETDNLGEDLTGAASASLPAIGVIVAFNSATSFDILLYSYATILAK